MPNSKGTSTICGVERNSDSNEGRPPHLGYHLPFSSLKKAVATLAKHPDRGHYAGSLRAISNIGCSIM